MKNTKDNISVQYKKIEKYERLCDALLIIGIMAECSLLINLLINY